MTDIEKQLHNKLMTLQNEFVTPRRQSKNKHDFTIYINVQGLS